MVPVLQGLGNEERKPGALMNESRVVNVTVIAMYTVLQKDQI